MDGDFYRRIPGRRWIRAGAKKLFKTRRRSIVTVIALLLILYVLVDNKGIVARIRLELQRSEMHEKVKQAEQETERLQANIKALQGEKKTIEKIARERHGMAREGETVYRVKKD